MIYYAFGLIAMMIVRPILSAKFFHGRGSKSIYAALYFFPILVVVQAVFAGLLCEYSAHKATVFLCFLEQTFCFWKKKNISFILWAWNSVFVSDYSFPYITLVLSIITSAAHFAYFEVQVRLTGNKIYACCVYENYNRPDMCGRSNSSVYRNVLARTCVCVHILNVKMFLVLSKAVSSLVNIPFQKARVNCRNNNQPFRYFGVFWHAVNISISFGVGMLRALENRLSVSF